MDVKYHTKMNKHKVDKMLPVLVLIFIQILSVQCYIDMDHLNSKAIYLEAKVGSHVIMDCPLEFPQEVLIPYVLHWNKDVSL